MDSKSRAGFSLFELVVYIAVVSVIMVSVLGIMLQSMASRTKALALHTVSYQSQFVVNRITADVRAADSIDAVDFSKQILTLTMVDGSVHSYALIDGSITLSVNQGVAEPLTTPLVTVDTFTITNSTAYGATIRDIDLTVGVSTSSSTQRPEYDAQATLTTTISTRL